MDPLPANLAQLGGTRRAQLWNAREQRAQELLARSDDSLTDTEVDELRQINDDFEMLREANGEPTRMTFSTGGRTGGEGPFSLAIRRAGWDPTTKARVTLGVGDGLLQSITFSDPIGSAAPVRLPAPDALGQDRRYIYPALRQVGMAETDTRVDYLRQTARSLAAPSDMVRGLDETGTKPTSTFTAGIESAELKQVAHTISGVPNIVARQRAFGDLINGEMRLGLSEALDYMVVQAVNGASLSMAGAGTNLAEHVRKAITVVTAAGYLPDVVAFPPGYAETFDIDLLTLQNSVGADGLWGLQPRVSKSLTVPIVFDSSAFGSVYLTPTAFQSFEMDAGASNSQLFRAELNAVAIIDRPDAACEVYAS